MHHYELYLSSKKIGQNNDFSQSYDVKRGKKNAKKMTSRLKKRLWVVLIILGSGAYFFLSNLRLGGAYKSGAYKKKTCSIFKNKLYK